MPRLAPVVLLGLVLALAGCGGSSGQTTPSARATTEPTPSPTATPARPERDATPTGPVTKAEEATIRGWSDALRRGDVERAVGFWAVPALASNGGQPYRLQTTRAIRFFNESLPCGAKLESTERRSRYVVATFRLSERPGPGRCGSGVGESARTAFLLRRGKIAQWLRAADVPRASDAPGGTTS
jgi:hypothetical protein